jgi:hypothetical protein
MPPSPSGSTRRTCRLIARGDGHFKRWSCSFALSLGPAVYSSAMICRALAAISRAIYDERSPLHYNGRVSMHSYSPVALQGIFLSASCSGRSASRSIDVAISTTVTGIPAYPSSRRSKARSRNRLERQNRKRRSGNAVPLKFHPAVARRSAELAGDFARGEYRFEPGAGLGAALQQTSQAFRQGAVIVEIDRAMAEAP